MKKNIVIIDYETGNTSAISNMLKKIGEKPKITDNYNEINNAELIILPGVGSFDSGIKKLEEKILKIYYKKK